MKKINELTEQEIRNLSCDDIELLIKFRKAEEGVKFITKPEKPEYFEIPGKDLTVYQAKFLGNSLSFNDIEDMNKLITLIKNSKGSFKIDYGVDSTYYANPKLYPYSGEWDEITSQSVYSYKLYQEVKNLILQNKSLEDKYKKELKEYQTSFDDSEWIEKEIRDKVYEVQNKYEQLETYYRLFKNEYLPLADNDTSIAIKFMNKAYSLNDEQKEYIFNEYDKEKTTEV